MAMLEVKDLQVYYGMIQAIKGISFEVNQGEVPDGRRGGGVQRSGGLVQKQQPGPVQHGHG